VCLLVAGDEVTYTFTLHNSGNQDLTNLHLQAASGTLANIQCGSATLPASLAVADSLQCTAQHTVTQAELEAGSFSHVVTISAAEVLAEDTFTTAAVVTSPQPGWSVTVATTGCSKPAKAREFSFCAMQQYITLHLAETCRPSCVVA
jgi:hypothetical protein